MAVNLYKSDDASAPVLTGSAGSLVALLDAVLVNGYGTKPGAGWAIAYTATNKRQYQMGEGGSGCQVFIDDAAPGTHGGREARMTGFKAGSAIGAGTGQFPTLAQTGVGIGAVVIRKSSAADTSSREWTIVADENTFYLFINTGDVSMTAPYCSGIMFGDFESYAPNDTNNCMVIGRTREGINTFGFDYSVSNYTWTSNYACENFTCLLSCSSNILLQPLNGHFVANGYNGIGGAVPCGKHSDSAKMCHSYENSAQMGYLGAGLGGGVSTILWPSNHPYPAIGDQGLYTAPVWITHSNSVRGHLRGIWCPVQHLPLGHRDTYAAAGNMAGKELVAITLWGVSRREMNNNSYATQNQVHVEYSDTWR